MELMEQLLNEPSANYRELKYGDVVDGFLMQIDRDEILVVGTLAGSDDDRSEIGGRSVAEVLQGGGVEPAVGIGAVGEEALELGLERTEVSPMR